MSIVFISYRRDDSAGYTGRLADRLAKDLGEDFVFRDYDNISPGQDFFKTIQDNLNIASVLLVIIGKEWLTVLDDSGRRRIDSPGDWVRLEIETALQRKIHIIPVLVKDARMPNPADLPKSISALAYRQAIELTDNRWEADVEDLIGLIHPILNYDGIDREAPIKHSVIGKLLANKKYGLLCVLVLLVSGFVWMTWLPADFSGRWYFSSGSYLMIVQRGDLVKLERIDPTMQKVYENGEGSVRGRRLDFTLKPIYTDRFSYSGRLKKSWDGKALHGELIEIMSGEQSALTLSNTNPIPLGNGSSNNK